MKKKIFWISSIFVLIIFLSIPIIHLLKTKWFERASSNTILSGYTNDASRLNLTKVDTIIYIPASKIEMEKQLQSILKYAEENSLKISIAGAQHSMGGHTIYPNGIVLNMLSYKFMDLDTVNNILTVGSGALWRDAIEYLDRFDRSIAVMQAFSSFSIGGSISVNGHGWQKDVPPISSSVISFTLINASGEIMNCSRDEHAELFKLVLGGYGLFGVILDIKLKVVSNTALKYKYVRLSSKNYIESYKKFVSNNPNVELVFGRLCISNQNFLEDATLNFFEKINARPPVLQTQDANSIESKRLVFRSTVNSEYGKRLRWDLETGFNKVSQHAIFSRNELLNDDVSLIENKDSNSTDILHEYFIPECNFYTFIQKMKPILLESEIDLMNITIRGVQHDTDSYMNYSTEDVFGFVLLFNQLKTLEQEKAMKKLTNALVEVTIECEGTFYLPYRLHIGKSKMREAYPQADAFFDLKKKYDPKELFNNKFYEHYK